MIWKRRILLKYVGSRYSFAQNFPMAPHVKIKKQSPNKKLCRLSWTLISFIILQLVKAALEVSLQYVLHHTKFAPSSDLLYLWLPVSGIL